MKAHRILFLYSELADYFLSCAEELRKESAIDALKIIHWDVNEEAPFNFDEYSSLDLQAKTTYSNQTELVQAVRDFSPTCIVVSGWMDADYMCVAKRYEPEIPVVLTMDNWWLGNWRQWLAVLSSRFYLRKHFNKAWVPGEKQFQYARKLGFSTKDIAKGFYFADAKKFEPVYEARKSNPGSKQTRKLLYVGRYIEVKGIQELWSAFVQLSPRFPQWELHCIGAGNLWNTREVHPKIFHHGFVQPSELHDYLIESDAFIMPSKKEPWGVVLHEMALAGLPLLASKQVGSSELFLEAGENGFSVDCAALEHSLRCLFKSSKPQLQAFGQHSRTLGKSLLHRQWISSLLQLSEKP